MTEFRSLAPVVCLGCGCACDDINVTLRDGKIGDIAPACPVGRAWFGDGTVPSAVLRDGNPATLDEALRTASELLVRAEGRLLVYIGADVTCETQRVALAIADMLRATVDSAISDTAAEGIVVTQRRGRAAATLGEIRNRADLIVFWGVDPNESYPRYLSRYALEPIGTHVPRGRNGRTAVAVSIGQDRGPANADLAITLAPADEITALSIMRATVLGTSVGSATETLSTTAAQAIDLAQRLMNAKYAVIVHDAEPTTEPRDPLRVEGLIALTQALNGPTRAALSSLRAGGNRSGAEAVFTWQTGFPFAVDYASGAPRYAPRRRGVARIAARATSVKASSSASLAADAPVNDFGAMLVIGALTEAGVYQSALISASRQVPTIVIGPRASELRMAAGVAIDTGVAGIHDAGTAYRMDDVPLPLRPPLPSPRMAESVLRDLQAAVLSRRGGTA